MSHSVFRATSRTKVHLGSSLGKGGEGQVFLAAGGQEVAKVYWPDKRSLELQQKLGVMVAHPPRDPMRAQGFVSLAWPTDLLLDPQGGFAGFLMPYLDTRKCRLLHQVYSPSEYPYGIDWRLLVQTARNLSAALEALHRDGYVVGDLNESNALAATNTVVTFVDCDSMQVRDPTRGVVYRCTVGKPEYTPPELQGRDFSRVDRAPTSDRFALAVLLCQLLIRGRHPFSGRPPYTIAENISAGRTIFANGFATAPGAMPPSNLLPPDVQRLFERAFVEGLHAPNRRPSARQWQGELDGLLHRMVTCSREVSHTYSGHMGACPWCAFERNYALRAFPKRRHPQRIARATPTPVQRVALVRNLPPVSPGWSWPRSGASRALQNLTSWFYRQTRRAAVGCILGLLIVLGVLLSLPFLTGGAGGTSSRPTPAQTSQEGGVSPVEPIPRQPPSPPQEQPPVETLLRQSVAARSNGGLWQQLGRALRIKGQPRLARSATALADLVTSEVPSPMRWSLGLETLDLLRSIGIEDDEWLGNEGDRATNEGREESGQVLYYLAHALDPDDREWLRKIVPREGLRVRRGLDWTRAYGNQDGDPGGTGVITGVPPETRPGWVAIEWSDSSETNWYRWGDAAKFDLALALPWSGVDV